MIPKETVDKILETSRVEEVIGDFIALKRRGVNFIGLCPFHGEKSPSFTVSPTKGIYKCFGCGKGGSAVNFVMDHEQLSYPDGLRWLAKKYRIEIKEIELTPEKVAENNDRESIFQVLAFAQKLFSNVLLNTEEGKVIGLSYFEERGFTPAIIEKFQLGYSPERSDFFVEEANKNAYKLEFAERASLITKRYGKDGYYGRFNGRVMFPIHNISGRVVGFGGRTLKKEKNIAKYVNSQQTEVYNKSEVLYGLYFAKKEMVAKDFCFLVEGYADVISMVAAGFENVVASSGTSLTTEQIKLIRRFTKNITILYDGDAAGIKASFRGIDKILEEGLNVKVLLFPDGEDPDSYSRKVSNSELQSFIDKNTQDFISFKTNLLIDETKGDPVKRANLIIEIVESIALIPEPVIRSVYVQECSRIMKIEESILHAEVNKLRRKSKEKNAEKKELEQQKTGENVTINLDEESDKNVGQNINDFTTDATFQELDVARILVLHGTRDIDMEVVIEDGTELNKDGIEVAKTKTILLPFKISQVIVHALQEDVFVFINEAHQKIYLEVANAVETDTFFDTKYFTNHVDEEIRKFAIDVWETPYTLHNWESRKIVVDSEEAQLKIMTNSAISSLRMKIIEKLKNELREELKKEITEENVNEILEQIINLDDGKKGYASALGRIVVR